MHIKQHAWVPSIPYLKQDVWLILPKVFTCHIHNSVTICELSTLHLPMQSKEESKQSLDWNFIGRNFTTLTYQKPLSINAVLSHDFLTVLVL